MQYCDSQTRSVLIPAFCASYISEIEKTTNYIKNINALSRAEIRAYNKQNILLRVLWQTDLQNVFEEADFGPAVTKLLLDLIDGLRAAHTLLKIGGVIQALEGSKHTPRSYLFHNDHSILLPIIRAFRLHM
jgi:hypothetical protein